MAIDTVDARTKLKPRRAPYWQKVANGKHLGYRKMTPGADGTWLAQAYNDESRQQTRRSLGSFDALPPNKRFDAASVAAAEWFKHLGLGGSTVPQTVNKACEAYVQHLRDEHRATTADDADARYRRWVYGDKIGKLELHKLSERQVEAWRRALVGAPVVVNPHADDPTVRKRSPSSVNRDMTALRAALNHARRTRATTSDMAWLYALSPIKNADGRRESYLDRRDRLAIIEAAAPDLAQLLRGLSLVPLRPGALANLTVSSFDKRLKVLIVGKDKKGGDRKIKLPPATAEFFEAQGKGKTPAAPLLARADGSTWNKDNWKKPVKAAVTAAKLEGNVTAYTMRHSVITDLVTNGLDLLTVAQLSGTSVLMIEKHYGHHRADHAAAALAALAL
jgi:integrase